MFTITFYVPLGFPGILHNMQNVFCFIIIRWGYLEDKLLLLTLDL